MTEDGPPLLRPIPRRPFETKLTSPTPPEDEDDDYAPNPNANLSTSRFLDAFSPSTSSLSRPQSFMNLTSSTLFGIYSPTTRDPNETDAPAAFDTPWGTGAHTPIKRPSVDEKTYELMKGRSHLRRQGSNHKSIDSTVPHTQPATKSTTTFSMMMRAGLLFALGVGYGMCLTRLQDSGQWPSLPEGLIRPDYSWNYLAFWGAGGVVLGALLPWFDKVWQDVFETEEEAVEISDEDSSASTDWASVMRAIGAFVGIIFAIVSFSIPTTISSILLNRHQRKLAWASTLQVSVTLALVNPLLWWLIDRSKAGFILSAAVGLTGSALLLGVNPEMMPAPSGLLHHTSSANSSVGAEFAIGGFAKQETVETGVWMLSVLFCSCVCFGNIGRRLAWSKSAVGRGRWGGVR